MNKLLVALLLVALLPGCKKKKQTPDPLAPVATGVRFTGITETDAIGNIVSIDSTDWGFHDVWTAAERGLFAVNYDTACLAVYPHQIVALPNPCTSRFSLFMDKSAGTLASFRLVDESFKTLTAVDSVASNAITFDAAGLGVRDTVRLYYKFIVNGTCEYRGHGDVVIR